jgi:hypothetical protein
MVPRVGVRIPMAGMDSFRRLAEIFSRFNISTAEQLEKLLAEVPEQGGSAYPSPGFADRDPSVQALGATICKELASLAGDVGLLSSGPGINQFTLLASQRLSAIASTGAETGS